MKILHIPTILVTLGLVGLVAILSGQNRVGPSHLTIDRIIDPVKISLSNANRQGISIELGPSADLDYIVPYGKFFVLKKYAVVGATMNQGNQNNPYEFTTSLKAIPQQYPDNYAANWFSVKFGWGSNGGPTQDLPFTSVNGSEFMGDAVIAFPGERIFHTIASVQNGTVTDYKWLLTGYLVDSE